MKTDLTEGSIAGKLAFFALNLIAANMIQQLYNMVDLIFAGQCLNENASAAIGASARLITCVISLFSGMAMGSGVMISNAFGSKNSEAVKNASWHALVIAGAAGVFFSVFAYFFSGTYLELLHTNAAIFQDAYDYLSIYALSLFSVLVYNMCAAILRALGDGRTPFISQIIAGTANIAFDAIMLLVFHKGIVGIALATLGSQTVAAVIVLFKVLHLQEIQNFRGGLPKLNSESFLRILSIGIPAGLQAFLITFSNVVGQYYVNTFAVSVVAGFAVHSKVDNLLYIPVFSLGQATMTFVAQNHGAGRLDRVWKGVRTAVAGGVVMTICIAAVTYIFARPICSVFTTSEAVLDATVEICLYFFPPYFLYVFLQVFGDSLRGLGHAKGPMIIVIFNMLGLRSLLFFLLVPKYHSVLSYSIVYPITWFATSVFMVTMYCVVKRKILHKGEQAL